MLRYDDGCMCDPDVWGPDGMERGDGHNPVCVNHGKERPAEEYRRERDLQMLDEIDNEWEYER